MLLLFLFFFSLLFALLRHAHGRYTHIPVHAGNFCVFMFYTKESVTPEMFYYHDFYYCFLALTPARTHYEHKRTIIHNKCIK